MLRTVSFRLVLLLLPLLLLAGCGAGPKNSSSASSSPKASPSIAPSVQATVSADKNLCFINPAGLSVPSIYAGSATPAAGPATAPALKGTPVVGQDGLEYLDIKPGTGSTAHVGSMIQANYTGWFASNCQKFDSSYDSHNGQSAGPLTIGLSTDQLIKGWVEGVNGMKVGGIRRIYIPSALGYGSQAQGPIPADSDLIFDVQLISAH